VAYIHSESQGTGGAVKNPGRKPILITVSYLSTCLTCEEQVQLGEQAWWVSGVGIWHELCEKPDNLETYISEAEQKEKSDRLWTPQSFNN